MSFHGRRQSPGSLDLSEIPPLSHPSPPSNTLLITNLNAPEIFTTSNLESIRAAINANAPLHSFSPLKSFRRIVCTFYTSADATRILQALDGETVLGNRTRVFFGAETNISPDEEQRYLKAPPAQKQFFISPPPSPPVGWEMRNEEPPNAMTHADDLVAALAKLNAQPSSPENPHHQEDEEGEVPRGRSVRRRRAGTGTLVYEPEDNQLPAIAVEDLSEGSPEGVITPAESIAPLHHTARPPVELME
ncbi:Calcipressin [Piedraia hortae CBS 480.64]|uniref:Calcipressin n=1 Tax=Piedraia hortae CBS 480.64 TaxID=1314780 RepID=A0A6A7C694_9PEZI|nr:Calcipressin [Piedraia hortae CBS 480.64]